MKRINLKNSMLTLSILYISFGVLFIIFKQEVLKWICSSLGVIVIVMGIIGLIKALKMNDYNAKNNAITLSLIAIVFGILLVVFAWVFILIMTIMVAIFFMLSGIFKLSNCISKKIDIAELIVSIMYVAVGILLLINNEVVYIVLGCILLIAGILDLIDEIVINKKEKIVRIEIDENVIDMEK